MCIRIKMFNGLLLVTSLYYIYGTPISSTVILVEPADLEQNHCTIHESLQVLLSKQPVSGVSVLYKQQQLWLFTLLMKTAVPFML